MGGVRKGQNFDLLIYEWSLIDKVTNVILNWFCKEGHFFRTDGRQTHVEVEIIVYISFIKKCNSTLLCD